MNPIDMIKQQAEDIIKKLHYIIGVNNTPNTFFRIELAIRILNKTKDEIIKKTVIDKDELIKKACFEAIDLAIVFSDQVNVAQMHINGEALKEIFKKDRNGGR